MDKFTTPFNDSGFSEIEICVAFTFCDAVFASPISGFVILVIFVMRWISFFHIDWVGLGTKYYFFYNLGQFSG